jgi:hypothetical protein
MFGRRPALLLAFVVLLTSAGRASAGTAEVCRDQAAIAERAAGIPSGLLLAIGKRESGRYDPRTGSVLPWPWAVDRDGDGHLFETREEAIAYVAAALRQGSRSIDVGCFQINLQYHPTAFATLEQAFDPAANAAYAARFLTELFARTASWETAVAYYHSATIERGVPYREAVYAAWRGVGGMPIATERSSAISFRVEMGMRVWGPGESDFIARPAAVAMPAPVTPHATPGLPVVVTPRTMTPKVFVPGALAPVALAPVAFLPKPVAAFRPMTRSGGLP